MVFHTRSDYDYHFVIKEQAEESKKQFNCLGENTSKYIIHAVSIEKEAMEKELQKMYLTHYILLIVQDLW